MMTGNNRGFDGVSNWGGISGRDQVKAHMVSRLYGNEMTFQNLDFRDKAPPVFDRLVTMVFIVPFDIDYAMVIPYAVDFDRAGKGQSAAKRSLSVSRSWVGREGIEDITEVVRDWIQLGGMATELHAAIVCDCRWRRRGELVPRHLERQTLQPVQVCYIH